jgi:hypothetical protein
MDLQSPGWKKRIFSSDVMLEDLLRKAPRAPWQVYQSQIAAQPSLAPDLDFVVFNQMD